MDNSNPGGEKGCMDHVNEYWAKVPFYNRCLLVVLPSLYLASWVYPIHLLAINKLDYTVYMRQCKFRQPHTFRLENPVRTHHAPPVAHAVFCIARIYSNRMHKRKDDRDCQDRNRIILDEYHRAACVSRPHLHFIVLH